MSRATEFGSGPGGSDSQDEAMSCLYIPLKLLTPFPWRRRWRFSLAARLYSSSRVSWSHKQSSHLRQTSYSEEELLEEIEARSPWDRGHMRMPWLWAPPYKDDQWQGGSAKDLLTHTLLGGSEKLYGKAIRCRTKNCSFIVLFYSN